MYDKLSAGLRLINELPRNVLNNINFLTNSQNLVGQTIEVTIISGDNVDNITRIVDNLGGVYEDLGYGYGIVTIPVDKLSELGRVKTIQYVELPKTLYTSDSISNSAICVPSARSTYEVEGQGVIVGFVDTGIDYMHPAFRNQDGTTRIEYIYDLSLGGIVYNKEQINQAIQSENPFDIVPSNDLIEHGTHVAGIACAGGNIPSIRYGVAPKSSIIMVKATRGNFTISTQMMRGIKFLVDKSKELNMPLVINLSLSTNDGAHNGRSLLETYISTVCNLERITIVIAAGNEGAASHHVGGELRPNQTISINVAEDERSISMSMYYDILPELVVQITNPSGRKSLEIPLRQGLNEGALDGNRILFYVSGPKPFDLTGEVLVSFVGVNSYLIAGEWKLNIRVTNQYRGNYDIWLPISEGLNPNTKFLQPELYNTLGIPATVSNVIAVGSYNNLTDTISPFSGRGRLGNVSSIKPDIIAPGERITAPVPNRRFDTKTGTSMATPHIAGVAALMMEWGILKGNDVFLYGERLKHYLIKGARRNRPNETYPNPIWGYGIACLYDSFEYLRNILNLPQSSIREESNMRKENNMRREGIMRKIIEYTGDIENAFRNFPGVRVIILDERVAIIEYPDTANFSSIISNAPEVVFTERSPVYTLNVISPVEASGAYLFNQNPYLSLNGRGVIVGIVDTGIDYLNREFMREDDTTRIISIWDQTIDNPNANFSGYGTVFTREQIDTAINMNFKGEDPYSVVNSKDDVGHGTMVAGLIGARGINREVAGAAPDCEFAIVKLKEASEAYVREAGISKPGVKKFENTDILLGIKYIIEEARRLLRPVIIYIPLGTNIGSHDGNSIIERYIDDLSKRRGLAVVTCTGNQGDSDTHTTGELKNTGDTKTIELRVGKNQQTLAFDIWLRKPDKVSLSIVSPSGEVIEKIPARLQQVEEVRFIFEGTVMFIEYSIPEEITGDELIRIKANNLREGIWQFRLIGDYIVDGRYNSWLPQRELLDDETKFLNSNQYTTLQLPATANRVLVAAFYNQNNTATVGRSGRGFTRDGRVKPDIAAGGIDALVISPGGGTRVVSGASVAGAVLAGCCALLMQWGIVDNNDPTMYSIKMEAYIIRGARIREGDVYPNREWGYGMLDMRGIFEGIRSAENSRRSCDEFYVGDLYIRKPN